MFRRNPDAIAILAFGMFMLALNVPRMLIREARWEVTPLTMQMQSEREQQVKAVQAELKAHREELRAAEEQIRSALRR